MCKYTFLFEDKICYIRVFYNIYRKTTSFPGRKNRGSALPELFRPAFPHSYSTDLFSHCLFFYNFAPTKKQIHYDTIHDRIR
jgi:hypothetical protein